jgi:predicted enzyme related to lactoylglutathione lyase
MSTPTKSKSRQSKKSKTTANIIWFEIPADNPERAKKFYGALFGWKIKKFPGMADYWHIDTGGGDDTPDGGLMARKQPQQPITNYVNVASVDKSAAKVEKLGGKICLSKTAVPEMGYFVICQDTENNTFALWEIDRNAK